MRLRLHLTTLVCLAVASLPVQAATPAMDDLLATIEALGLDAGEVMAPLVVTDEMRTWLAAEVPRHLTTEERVLTLLRRLLLDDGLGVHYEVGFTGTAEEVFASRVANCLGFTQMFVAMSRELGVPAYYLAVDRLTNFERRSDLIIVSDHVTAAFDQGPNRRILEFSIGPDYDYRAARRMDDLSALALYYSNRGAELVQKQRIDEAVAQLEIAVRLAPGLAQAWTNLGVARRRQGDLDGAEACYRRAIEIDRNQMSAYHNMVGLYRVRGLHDPAGQILDLLDKRKNRNPFIYLELGDLSRKRAQDSEAGRFYRRAVRLGRVHAETHAAYGLWHLEAGDVREARKLLERAERRDPSEARTAALRARLAEID